MKGLLLFVRPIEPDDATVVETFLARHRDPGAPAHRPAWGLLGKLLGDVVAVLGAREEEGELLIEELLVARELRKKRIGRVMIREVTTLAAKLDLERVVIHECNGAAEFLRRVGFASEGDRWVLAVPQTASRD